MKIHVLFLAACVATTVQAGELNVGLEVRANPEIKREFSGCLRSELAALGDVAIAERSADSSYLLSVSAIRADAFGETPAILVAVRGVTRIFSPGKLSMDTDSVAGQHYQKAYEGYAAFTFLDVSVAAPLADLPELCKGIVVKFNTDVLAAERQVDEKLARQPSAEEQEMLARLSQEKSAPE